jgi:subfamily B ATP-binding cassette protein MsbA
MTTFRRMLAYIKPYRSRFLMALVGMAIFTLISVLPPLVMRYLMDEVVIPGRWNRLLAVAALIVIVPVAAEVTRFLNMRVVLHVARRFVADMRLAMYRKVMGLSLRYHGDSSAGALINRIMDDTNMIQRLLAGDAIRLIVDVIVFLFSLTVMFTVSTIAGLILCALLILYYLAYRFFSRRIRATTKSYRSIYDQIAGRLQETVAGVRQVRIYNREAWENTQFLDRTSSGLEKHLATRISTVNLSTACTAIAGFGSVAISGIAAYFILRGRITYGDYLAINSYLWLSINPVTRLTNLAGQLAETFVSVDRISELLEEEPDIQSAPDARALPPIRGEVEFRNVYFQYESSKPLYRGFSLKVEPGMTVALVGPTGCGKTSLTSLLMRYWDIQGGEILIDGTDIRSVTLESLRSQFGVVLQDPIVFDGSLADNIAYGTPTAGLEQIEEAAKAAEIYDLATSLPESFDTVLGTEGVKLSVGEKQRVSIARAILKDPAILIMDEATSSLDSYSEALIQKALARVLKGRTSFVVAHRLSTITAADMIVVMDNGAIVEQGSHGELMSLPDGLYRGLYQELLGKWQEVG